MFTDFEFNGKRASDYELIVGSFNGNSGTESVSSGADISFNQAKTGGSNKFNLYSSTYETAYTTTFQVVKNPWIYKTRKDRYLTVNEVSSIQRWLCKKDGYYKFRTNDDAYKNIYWKGTFSSKQINFNGGIIGLELTLTTDAPYAYLDEIMIDVDCSSATPNAPVSFDIYDMSDEEGYIYPDMTITFLEDSVSEDDGFILKNSMTDDKVTRINGFTSGEVITIDGSHQIITVYPERQISKDFNFLFPRLVNTYTNNKNTFTCNQKCLITISYSPIRKIGI